MYWYKEGYDLPDCLEDAFEKHNWGGRRPLYIDNYIKDVPMSNTVLVIGQSGSGKSTSIRNLDPKETFIINVLDKPLPLRGYKKNYKSMKGWDDKEANYYASDDWQRIVKCIDVVTNNLPHIKNLIIDDWQYVMANEFMRRATERGFDKYSELGQHAWITINALMKTRPDLTCFVLAHSDLDNTGRAKCKTIGKMLDEKITIEGMFTTVLHAIVSDNHYKFLTQNDGDHIAKSPLGMFTDLFIDNDLALVKQAVDSYYNEE